MPETKVKFEDKKSPDKDLDRRNDRKKKNHKEKYKNRKKKPHYGNPRDRRKKVSSFKGGIDAMNGHVFEMFSEGASTVQFTRTCEQLEGYVLRSYKYGTDLQIIIRTMEHIVIDVPSDPVPSVDASGQVIPIPESVKYIWHSQLKYHVTRVRMLRENSASLFSVIWSQCSKPMQSKVRTADVFETVERSSDFLGLLKEIKSIV